MKHLILILLTTVFLLSVEAQISVYPYQFEGKCGLVNENNEKVTEAVFDHIWLFPNQKYNAYTKFSKKSEEGQTNFGLIDKEGIIVVPAEYEDLQYGGNGSYYVVTVNGLHQIRSIEDDKLIRELKLGYFKEQNGIIVFRPEDQKTYTALFKNGKLLDLPHAQNGSYESFPKNFTFDDTSSACPTLIVDNDAYDCMGEAVNYQEDLFRQQVGGAEFQQGYEDPLTALEAKYPNQKITPVENRFDRVVSYIVGKNLVVSPKGDTLFCTKKYNFIRMMKPFTSHFEDEAVYIKYGNYVYSGLLSSLGEEILDLKYDIAPPSKRDFELDNSVNQEELFYIKHHPSGYGGFLSRDGKNLLPVECECIR